MPWVPGQMHKAEAFFLARSLLRNSVAKATLVQVMWIFSELWAGDQVYTIPFGEYYAMGGRGELSFTVITRARGRDFHSYRPVTGIFTRNVVAIRLASSVDDILRGL
ncbi:hypothetical protein OIU79_019090 [Salix purpurea]|uniref:Uncharacterized protein n=1 Tax=Salix purpurea TaxID=77065 RepID=A0A9Q0SJF9_SALPP|nr:hypothetical protein OIU79_019090 [Salix purpurea]